MVRKMFFAFFFLLRKKQLTLLSSPPDPLPPLPRSVDRDGTLAFFEQARLASLTSSPPSSASSSSLLPPAPPPLRVFVMVATFEGRESRRAEAISEAKEEAVDRVISAAKAEAAKAASAAAVSSSGGSGAPRTSTLKVRILRPTAFFRDMSSWLLEPLLAGNKRDVVLTGDGGTKINPVDGRDVARLIREEIEAAVAPRFGTGRDD